jgi:hypothetical protein
MRRAVGFALSIAVLGGCAPEGPTGFVSFNLVPDSSCTYSPTSTNEFYPYGVYDLGASPGGTGYCDRSYVLHLLVNSYLRSNRDDELGRAEPNILQIHSAEVKLMTLRKEVFDFPDGLNGKRPNPFLVTTNNSLAPAAGNSPSMGIAALEAIPVDYAEPLLDFVDTQILAEIQIFGTTTGDVDIEFKPFVYPIELCEGCLKMCYGDLEDLMLAPEEIYMDECPDNAGADGRVCIDPNC